MKELSNFKIILIRFCVLQATFFTGDIFQGPDKYLKHIDKKINVA